MSPTKERILSRSIDGFWCTWVDGQDWPSWYYGESTAREAAKRLALSHPGRVVHVCDLNLVAKVRLPDSLEVTSP